MQFLDLPVLGKLQEYLIFYKKLTYVVVHTIYS